MTEPALTLFLKPGMDRRLKKGHPWVFSNELEQIPGNWTAGCLTEVVNPKKQSYGTGFFNPSSLISVRLLQTDLKVLTQAFFEERLADAQKLRETLFPGETAYRLCFGESDFLPGLVIDRYGDFFALQALSAGIDLHLPLVTGALLNLFPGTKGIAEKNTSHLRKLEGLPLRDGILFGEVPDQVSMTENGIRYSISLLDGQKTGFFLDQKVNRVKVRELAAGKKVLDCFTNQGGFALNAAVGGAASVTGVDLSEQAVNACRENARLNGVRAEFVQEDVFRFLTRIRDKKEPVEFVILDPPSFAKSKKNIPAAKKGYAELNRLGLSLIPQGGFLATGSCSQHLFEETFLEIVKEEAFTAGRQLRLVYRGNQSPDHPVLESMAETRYLKFFIFQVI